MKLVDTTKENGFNDLHMSRLLVHDSPYFKILNFNFKAGQQLPIHHHDLEGRSASPFWKGKGNSLERMSYCRRKREMS